MKFEALEGVHEPNEILLTPLLIPPTNTNKIPPTLAEWVSGEWN